MPRSRAWFSLSHPAEPDCDLGRQRSVGAAVICALFIGSAILALAASKSLDVTSAIAEEPVAPIPEPPPAAALKIAIGERLFADPRLSRSRTKAAREAVPRVTTSARMAPARASRISLWMARSFPSIPAPSSTPRSASDSIGREDSAPSNHRPSPRWRTPESWVPRSQRWSKGSAPTRTWFVNSVPPTDVDPIVRTCWMPLPSSSARS